MNTNTTPDAAGATSPADSTTTIECHENRISGKGVDYTARAWYVRKDGKLHGQFMTENEAISFEQARADFRERHADGDPNSIAAGEQ